jgi:hypothetical protein
MVIRYPLLDFTQRRKERKGKKRHAEIFIICLESTLRHYLKHFAPLLTLREIFFLCV